MLYKDFGSSSDYFELLVEKLSSSSSQAFSF